MDSSRIFIRGLPPSITEADFKKHFSAQSAITDAKLFSHRRIGYVGYKTPQDAAKAVKYFNKTFIKLSRISVELARSVAESTPFQKQPHNDSRNAGQDTLSVARGYVKEQEKENPLKRKRGDASTEKPAKKDDPKLKEYLEVMERPSKSKSWMHEDVDTANKDITAIEESENEARVPEEDESDAEVQTLPKKLKPAKESTHAALQNPDALPTADDLEDVRPEDSAMRDDNEPSEDSVPALAITDDDWVRSKTSRLLGLVDDEEEKAHPKTNRTREPDVSMDDPESSNEKDVRNTAKPTSSAQNVDPDPDPEDDAEMDAEVQQVLEHGRLFLRNLSYITTEDDIRDAFQNFGVVQEVHIPVDAKAKSPKGIAFVEFEEPSDALKAMINLNGTIFQGRLLHVLPGAAKRGKLDELAISKLPLKKQKEIRKKVEASSTQFNWNSLYMNTDSVMASISDRLGVSKSELLDPTSSDAAVKQAHAETHIIQETKGYFEQNGVDLEAFKKQKRGDTAILVKNFPYGTKVGELRKLFEAHGELTRLLMPPNGTIAIVEFANPPQARSAFGSLAYRKIKDSVLFLEKAPKDLFTGPPKTSEVPETAGPAPGTTRISATDLLRNEPEDSALNTSTLFVRNLNFTTTSEELGKVFKPLDGFLTAKVKTKPNPKKPGETLSMGFGFLEFRSKAQAEAARAAMDGCNLEGHALVIKASQRTLDAAEERRKEDKAKKAAARQTKVIIKNLPFESSKKDVRALLGAYGQLRSVRVPKKFDNSARGFAFAEFTTPREASNAMEALRNTHLLGRRLVLDYAEADPEDAEAELDKMQKKVGSQVNKVALQRLTGTNRKKFTVAEEGEESS
ncbi:putative pre-rRNA processing protein Mrd1 [Aulographum hederae CBS 113979]|uniref:Multiple RNA-binding domain-containing protein 1 n=1 Tax=Aulographum hederae CBS 113979 TaxID=1176131 RepID=A0A6G1GXQ8_9PEZI|nr:putative pre-rRNA processing protein Mrd1 [Aulographum hederae CBS 113979]